MSEGPLRRILRGEGPIRRLLRGPSTGQSLPTVKVGDEKARIREEYRRRWLEEGIPPHFVEWALDMAEKWSSGIADFQIRTLRNLLDEELIKKIEPELRLKLYRQGLEEAATKWLGEMVARPPSS